MISLLLDFNTKLTSDIVMVICYIAINHCVVCPVVALHSQLSTVTCNGWVQSCSPKLARNFFFDAPSNLIHWPSKTLQSEDHHKLTNLFA